MPSKRYIDESWQKYREIAVYGGLPDPYIAQLEQAFKVGALVMHELMLNNVGSDNDVRPPEVRFMMDVHEELAEIGAAVDDRVLGAVSH